MLGVFGMPSTPTIGKEAFLWWPTYSVKTDLDAPISRKKEMCFPDTIPVTHGSVYSQVARALWSRFCQSSSGNIGIGSSVGRLFGIWDCTWGKSCFPADTVHPPVSPFSTLWACPLFLHWNLASEGCLPGPLCGFFFWLVWGIWFWFWRMEACIWYFLLVFFAVFFVP
jgi:hypothetical protein